MARLRPVRRSSVRLLLVGMLASGLAACGGSPNHGPTVAVVSVCQAALTDLHPSPSEVEFIQTATVKRAEATGGSAFSGVVKTWVATTETGCSDSDCQSSRSSL